MFFDDSFDTPRTDLPRRLAKFLGDDVGASIWVEEPMTNDLADELVRATIASFGSAFLRDEPLCSGFFKLLSKLKIALATESEFVRGGFRSKFTFAFQQHSQASGDLIVFQDVEIADGTDEGIAFGVKFSHDSSSLTRCIKPADAGGRTIRPTAISRQQKYGGGDIKLQNLRSIGSTKAVLWIVPPPQFTRLKMAPTAASVCGYRSNSLNNGPFKIAARCTRRRMATLVHFGRPSDSGRTARVACPYRDRRCVSDVVIAFVSSFG